MKKSIHFFDFLKEKIFKSGLFDDYCHSVAQTQLDCFSLYQTSESWEEKHFEYLKELNNILGQTYKKLFGEISHDEQLSSHKDRRFQDKDWENNPLFFYLKETYLLQSKYIESIFKFVKDDDIQSKKNNFYLKILIDALSPTNFPFTNPEIIRETFKQNGKNLLKGYQNFLDDQQKGDGVIMPPLTDLNAFKVGENLATTSGKVIFQNKILQLLEYLPKEEPFYETPLMLIPAWINKYYIFDLQPHNSFIKWNIDAGRPVYVISWVNPDASYAKVPLKDYFLKGIDKAIDVVREVTSSSSVNAVGFCVGGVGLLTLLAYYQSKKLYKIKSATLLAAPTNFLEMGDLSLFVSEDQMSSLEKSIQKQGALAGSTMMQIFRALRANELIWPNYINSYFLGRNFAALDFLFWNSDTTNLPAKMHLEYLKSFFIGNAFMHPKKYKLGGVGININEILNPCFIVATQKDHIVPWKAAFAAFQKLKNSEFVLGGSGHIAGIINPPVNNKYGYKTNSSAHTATPEEWMKGAIEHTGSWWNYWEQWISPFVGKKVLTAEKITSSFLEKSPGSYALKVAPSLEKRSL